MENLSPNTCPQQLDSKVSEPATNSREVRAEATTPVVAFRPGQTARIKIRGESREVELHLNQSKADFEKTIGATDWDFILGITCQLNKLGIPPTENSTNFMLSIIRSLAPKNPKQTMLALHMANVHMQIVRYTERLTNARTVQEISLYEVGFNKLYRTFANLYEVFERSQSGSENKLAVQNVSIGGNAQAIVGNVTNNAGQEPQHRQVTAADDDTIAAPNKSRVAKAKPDNGRQE